MEAPGQLSVMDAEAHHILEYQKVRVARYTCSCSHPYKQYFSRTKSLNKMHSIPLSIVISLFIRSTHMCTVHADELISA